MTEVKEVIVVLRGKYYEMMTPIVHVKWECPICKAKMGEPKNHNFCDNDDWYNCHTWKNECGHVAVYGELEIETTKGFRTWKEAKASGERLLDFCIDAARILPQYK